MNALDYLNINSLRNYPITDGVSRVSTDGLFTIPNTLIVDLTLSAAGVGSAGFYISSITSTSATLSIEISVISGSVFGVFYSALPNTSENFDLVLAPSTSYPDATGLITIGTVDDLDNLPSGTFEFDSTATTLLSRIAAQANIGITRITFNDTQGNNFTLSGHVYITANSNVQFAANGSNNVLLNAGEDLGLNKICSANGTPILTINGVSPDSTGNFSFIPDDSCIQVSSIPYGVMISDSCGTPCLGCSDISTLTDRVNTLESDIFAIRDFTNNLQNAIDQANTLIGFQCQT